MVFVNEIIEEILEELEKYRKKTKESKLLEMKDNTLSFIEIKNKIQEIKKFGINKKLKINGGISEVNNDDFINRLNYLLNESILNEYLTSFELLNEDWYQMGNYLYRLNTKEQTLVNHEYESNMYNSVIVDDMDKIEEKNVINWLGNLLKHEKINLNNIVLHKKTQLDCVNKKYMTVYRKNNYNRNIDERNIYFLKLLNKYKLLYENINIIDKNDTVILDINGVNKIKPFDFILKNINEKIKIEVDIFIKNILNLTRNVGDLNININLIEKYLKYIDSIKDFYTKKNFGSYWIELPSLLLENQKIVLNHKWKESIDNK